MSNTKKPLKEAYLAFQLIPRVKEGNNFEVVDPSY
jgi:hypothetical protein